MSDEIKNCELCGHVDHPEMKCNECECGAPVVAPAEGAPVE